MLIESRPSIHTSKENLHRTKQTPNEALYTSNYHISITKGSPIKTKTKPMPGYYKDVFRFIATLAFGVLISKYILPIKTGASHFIEHACPGFPTANNVLSAALRASINECRQFNKPSVLMLLYQNMPEYKVNQHLQSISNYASCNLSSVHSKPIFLYPYDFDRLEVRNDYGVIINKYRDALKERSVMVVQHLSDIPSAAAQAFHSFCDEYSPVVKKSFFIFTMKVEKYIKSDFKLVRTVLRDSWSELHEDIFEPLLTRITSMIVHLD